MTAGKPQIQTDLLKDRCLQLESMASVLKADAARRAAGFEAARNHGESFLEALPGRPVYQPPGDRDEALAAMQIGEDGSSLDDALSIVAKYVDGVGHNLGSGRFFAYIPSGGLYEAAIADYVAAVSNRYSGVGYAAPGATRMEEALIRWLSDVIGYPETANGDLTSGGSMAALSAVVCAREARGVRAADVHRHVVYMTEQKHHTFRKALHVAGVGECVQREIPMDDGFRMQSELLSEAIAKDRAKGLVPWFIGATGGTTDTGAVDPLDALADIAEREDVWMHVDAAYGGAFVLCDEGRRRLNGLSRADSLIVDPHKGFFLPGGVGVLLVKDGQLLQNAFRARGVYMQDMEDDPERSPCDLSPELTRPFRALKFWLPFKVHGSAPFAAALEEKMLLAKYFHEEISAIDGMEVGPVPDLSIVVFRALPESGDANAFNEKLVEAIRDDGRIFVTSTTINGKYVIRMAILGYDTHIADIDVALQVIEEKVTALRGA